MSGTSMAAPSASVVLALEFAAKSELTAADAVDVRYESARGIGDEGWGRETCYGEVDACAAVKLVSGYRLSEAIDSKTVDLTGWCTPDEGATYYWYEKGTRRTTAGRLETDQLPSGGSDGLQRYWIGEDGALVGGASLTLMRAMASGGPTRVRRAMWTGPLRRLRRIGLLG